MLLTHAARDSTLQEPIGAGIGLPDKRRSDPDRPCAEMAQVVPLRSQRP